MRSPLDSRQLTALPDDVLARWADAYANSCNAPALAQVQREQARRRQLVAHYAATLALIEANPHNMPPAAQAKARAACERQMALVGA